AERTVGAVLAGALARQPVPRAARSVEYRLTGAAGQSLGAFLGSDLAVQLEGIANDYVGKGLSGGHVVVRAPGAATFGAGGEVVAHGAAGSARAEFLLDRWDDAMGEFVVIEPLAVPAMPVVAIPAVPVAAVLVSATPSRIATEAIPARR